MVVSISGGGGHGIGSKDNSPTQPGLDDIRGMYIRVKPKTLNAFTITLSDDTVLTKSNFQDTGDDYLQYFTTNLSALYVTSATSTGYISQIITVVEGRYYINTITFAANTPGNLYGWTDLSMSPNQLYAWTTGNTSLHYADDIFRTLYTDSTTVTPTSNIYLKGGEAINLSSITSVVNSQVEHLDHIAPASSNDTITLVGENGTEFSFVRDAIRDTTPPTVYTSFATLSTGIPLYDSRGSSLGINVGLVNSNNTFSVQHPAFTTYYGFYYADGQAPYYYFSDTPNPTAGDAVYTVDLLNGTLSQDTSAQFVSGSVIEINNGMYINRLNVTNCSDCLYFEYDNVSHNNYWILNAQVNYGRYIFYTANTAAYPLYDRVLTSNLVTIQDNKYIIHNSVRSLKFALTDYDSTFVMTNYNNCTLSGTNNRIVTPLDYSLLVSITGTVDD